MTKQARQSLPKRCTFASFPQEDNPEANNESFYLEDNYLNLLESLSQRKYRKVLCEIKRLEKLFSNCSSYWKASSLKIKAIEMIIDRKFRKTKELTLSSLTKWLILKENSIEHWSNDLLNQIKSSNSHDDEANDFKGMDRANKLELLIGFVLKHCLQLAQFSVNAKEGSIIDSMAFLAIGENIIRRASGFILSPPSLFVIQQIYLFLSSLYIMNESYKTSRRYLTLLLKLAYKQIELNADSELVSVIVVDKLNGDEIDQLREIFFNVTTALYQLGVCYENEGELKKAHQAYKQSRWFAYSFQRKSHPELIKLLSGVERRMLLRINLIRFFNEESKDCPYGKENECTQQKPFNAQEEKMKKHQQLIEYIEGLKVPDVDDEDNDLLNRVGEKPMSEKVNIATKTVHVLNHLMSDQFKGVVKQMRSIEINSLSNENKALIHKKINCIKMNQRMKLGYEAHRIAAQRNLPVSLSQETQLNVIEKSSSSKVLEDLKVTRHRSKSIKERHQCKLNSNNCNAQNAIGNQLTNSNQQTQSQSSARILSTNQPHPNHIINYKPRRLFPRKFNENEAPPEKFAYSKYIFSTDFKAKTKQFEHQYNKELKFQKELLKSKTEERVCLTLPPNEKTVQDECCHYFKATLYKNISIFAESRTENNGKGYYDLTGNTVHLSNIKRNTTKHPTMTRHSFYSPFDSARVEKFNKEKDPNKLYLNNIEQDIEVIHHKKQFIKNQMKKRMSDTLKKRRS